MGNKILAGINTEDGEIVLREVPSVRLNSRVVMFGKASVRVFSIGNLALAIGRSSATIRRWQRIGVIPPPLISLPSKERYYIKEEIETYKRVMQTFGLRTGSDIEASGFPKQIHAEIQALRRKLSAAIEKAGGVLK